MFDTLIKLNSIIIDGFLTKKIILLLDKKREFYLNNSLNEENLTILKKALRYIELIKNGREIVVNNNIVKNPDRSLEVFNRTLNALDQSEKALTIEKFNQIINISEEHIKNSIISMTIIEKNIDVSLILFESIKDYLIKEADKINLNNSVF
jgi:hypothetical protein